MKHFNSFLNKNYSKYKSFNDADTNNFKFKFKDYLVEVGFKISDKGKINAYEMNNIIYVLDFIKDFYDDREETEKDIWYSKNIVGAKIPASGAVTGTYNSMTFTKIQSLL